MANMSEILNRDHRTTISLSKIMNRSIDRAYSKSKINSFETFESCENCQCKSQDGQCSIRNKKKSTILFTLFMTKSKSKNFS